MWPRSSPDHRGCCILPGSWRISVGLPIFSHMNSLMLSAWAAPILSALKDLEDVIRDFPGDASMLSEVERRIKSLPLPDFVILGDEYANGMESASAADITAAVSARQHTAMFAAKDNSFGPLASAIERIARKTPITSALRSSAWDRVPLAFRERGQFSAGVESVRVMGTIQAQLLKAVSQQKEQLAKGHERYVTRDSFIRTVRQTALDEGLDTGKGNVLTNIAAPRRIGLIYDMQQAQAAGYARWKMDNDADALAILPAWRLTDSRAKAPREDWPQRWAAAGTAVGWRGAARDDFVALKTSPIWAKLSRFGTPWPPFDWGSTREVEDVWRDEAETLGLVKPNERIEPTMEKDFNTELEASVEGWRPDQVSTLKLAFGDQVVERGGKVQWRGNVIGDLAVEIEKRGLDVPFDNKAFKGRSLNLGVATDQAQRKASAAGIDIKGKTLVVTPDTIYHMLKRHGAGREKDGTQRPMTITDVEIVPFVWINPDLVVEDKDGIRFEKRIAGRQQVVVFEKGKDSLLPVSVRVKKR